MLRTADRDRAAGGTPVLGAQAVVIGGSLAGLLAARVLADYFGQVTVVERDPLPDTVGPRKGVPQSRHSHGLLGMGQQIMTRYFPDLFEDLHAHGSTPLDLGHDTGWFQAGVWRVRTDSGMPVAAQSRPFLEAAVRRRVRALPNVNFMTEYATTGLATDATRARVTGVAVESASAEARTRLTLPADFVVDASGRGSQMPAWLEGLGYPRVEEAQVKMDVGYTTCFFRRPPGFAAPWKMLLLLPDPPATRMGLLIPMEDNQWMVSLCGWHRDYAPTDRAGFLEYARSLPVPTLYEAIKDAEPTTPISVHKIPSNQWRHYERMARFPEGLAVLGDALCAFNPTYGQGMTAAALDVEVLDTCLAAQARGGANVTGLADRFRRKVAGAVATPWMLATTEDFRYPQTTGRRPPPTPILHWYLGRLYRAAEHDPQLVTAFLRVMHMYSAPPSLFAPPIALRVLFPRRRARPAPAAPPVLAG